MLYNKYEQSIIEIQDDQGETKGTGFFISQECNIVTCWHVIDSLSSIWLKFKGQKYEAQLLSEYCNPDSDIALLSSNINPDFKKYLRLDNDLTIDDDLISIGFPKDHLNNCPNGFNTKGTLVAHTVIKDNETSHRVLMLKDMEIEEGMSGAPVIAVRTGNAVGLITGKYGKREYGIAIPAEIISLCIPLFLHKEKEEYKGIFHSYLVNQEQLLREVQVVGQDIVRVSLIEIDSFGKREKPTTFDNFRNDILFSKNWSAIIVGEAGIGKTTELLNLTRYLSAEVIQGRTDCLIPIYLELRRFYSKNGNTDDVKRYIIQEICLYDYDKEKLFRELQQKGRFLIIFDGLNEIESEYYSKSIDALIGFMQSYSNITYIMSTRYYRFDNRLKNIIRVSMKLYELQRWNNKQIEAYFYKNQAADLYKQMDAKIQELCRLPFTASLLLNLLKNDPESEYPSTKGDLYNKYIEYIFIRRDQNRIENKFDKDIKNDLLANIGYLLNYKYKILSIKYEIIQNEFQNILNFKEIIKEIIRNGILKKGGGYFLKDIEPETPIEFIHQSVQEYYTALYIKMKPKNEFINYVPMADLEDALWRDVPTYLAGLLDQPLPFIFLLIERNYLLTAAQCIVSCKCNKEQFTNTVNEIIEENLIHSIQQPNYNKDAVEIVRTLGEEAINLLLSYLNNTEDIIKVIALSGDENIEKEWRKYGRIIYILGELDVKDLAQKLKNIYKHVKDIHLLYHIVIALYGMTNDEAFNSLQDEYLTKHNDPVIRTISLLGELKRNNGGKLDNKLRELIPALTQNINIKDEMSFAIRAHSAEAIGLLGIEEAIEPLANLLKQEKRPEPQSSAIKALGYIAYKYKQDNVELYVTRKIIDILINTLASGNIDNTAWGMKYIKENLIYLCDTSEIKKLSDGIEIIKKSNSNESVKLSKIKILKEIIQGLEY